MYSLAEIGPPFEGGHVSPEESTVTEHSGGGRKKRKDVSSEEKDLSGKRMKLERDRNDSGKSKLAEVETSLDDGDKRVDDEHSIKLCEPSKQDFIHVRARRGQATDSHSLAERVMHLNFHPFEFVIKSILNIEQKIDAFKYDSFTLIRRFWQAGREKISERMRILQDLVPGCNKVIGKALVLDEIINYVQSLQHQVELLSLKLEAGC